VIRKPTYDPFKDENVFYWILSAAESYRELKRAENHAIKEAAAKSKKLDRPKVAY
jgi:hypothetical protein